MSRGSAFILASGIALAAVLLAWALPGPSPAAAPALAGIGAVVWALMAVLEARKKRELPVFTPIFAGLALGAALVVLGPSVPGALDGTMVRGWSAYHYYVGSKYFEDTGYFDLYAATLAADDAFVAGGGDPKEGWFDADRARDMRSYSLRPRQEVVAGFDAAAVPPARLAALGADSRYFRRQERPANRRKLVLDMGFNPAPPWLLLGEPLSRAVPAGGPGFFVITASDLLMHALLFLALLWGFGPRVACVAVFWMLTVPLNRSRLVGAFFSYDWLAASAWALALWRRERPALSAVALSWAAMTRVFPGLMALPVLAAGVGLLGRGSRAKAARFSRVFVLACGVLFVASHFTGQGLQTWPSWVEKIRVHSAHHPKTGSKRVGLGRLVLQHPRAGRFWAVPRHPSPDQEASSHRRKLAGAALGLALLAFALRRRTVDEAMLLMVFAVWLGTTSSRYYASVWLLLFTLPRDGPGRYAGALLMAMSALFYLEPTVTGRYLALNWGALALFVGLCGLYLVRDRRGTGSASAGAG